MDILNKDLDVIDMTMKPPMCEEIHGRCKEKRCPRFKVVQDEHSHTIHCELYGELVYECEPVK